MKPKELNEQPITIEGESLYFFETAYVADGTRAIVCETAGEIPYATATVNLGDYGIQMADNEIALNHDLSPAFKEAFIKHFGTGERRPVRYGFAESEIVTLKPEVAS